MRRPLASALLAAVFVPLSGCCSLSRLWCGPDRSEWVSVDYRTPRDAVRTLLEALRRDDPEIIYKSLSNDYRNRMRITEETAELFWPRIREENPGLHLAGYVEVPEPTRHGPERASVVLDVEGIALAIELYRESLWEVHYDRREFDEAGNFVGYGPAGDAGGSLNSFASHARIRAIQEGDPGYDPDRWESRLSLEPIVFEHHGRDEVPLEDLTFVGLLREWKVANIATRPDDDQ